MFPAMADSRRPLKPLGVPDGLGLGERGNLIWALARAVDRRQDDALDVVDRALLNLEARGWINYRRKGLSKGAATYHTLELHSIIEPGMKEVQEVKYAEEIEEEESGEPPVGGGRPPSGDGGGARGE